MKHLQAVPNEQNEVPLTSSVRTHLQLFATSFIAEIKSEAQKALPDPKALQILGALTAFTPMLNRYLEKMPDADAQRIYENAKQFVQSVDEALAK